MEYYNPLNKFYKSVIGAISCEKEITFRVKGNFDSVFFMFRKDGEDSYNFLPLDRKDGYFEITTTFNDCGLYFYKFKADNFYVSLGKDFTGEINGENEFQLSVYDNEYSTPDWLKGGIIYQIFPDRFNIFGEVLDKNKNRVIHTDKTENPYFLPNEKGEVLNNDFYGGNFLGIIEKLDYLKSLGITAIYLNPIFKAYSNHRYDTGDYLTIDPMLGTEEDFKALIDECNKKGIKLILDGVFNHTGADSMYFNKYGNYDYLGAYQSKDSPYYNWYQFDKYPNEYKSWWGIKTLPQIDKGNEDYIKFITEKVIPKYIKLGIGGIRLDVVDELPSKFVRKIRSAVKENNKDAVIIGEVWEDASNKISYDVRREYFLGKELDSVMNYPLKNAIIDFVVYGDAKNFSLKIKTLLDHYPKCVLDSLMNILSTHDTVRILSVLSGEEYLDKTKEEKAEIKLSNSQINLAKTRLKIAVLLEYTVFGVPSVYYGDEAGMQGFFDPYNRRFFPWGKEDKDLLSWHIKLGEIRKSYSAFKDGEFIEVYSGGGVYSFIRKDDDSEILIAVNCGKNDGGIYFNGDLFDLITEKTYTNKIELKSGDAKILIKKLDK